MSEPEEVLSGGNVAEEVVRVGATVRKPANPATDSVDAFLKHLAALGFSGAPRSFGRDERDRHVLEYIPGSVSETQGAMSLADLTRVGRLIRQLHDAAETFAPPASARWNVVIAPDRKDLICHHDLAPWNLVRDGDRWVFIDWDGAGPGSRLWDLAYAAHGFLPFAADGDPEHDAPRLRTLVDGYGLDRSQRQDLPRHLVDRTRAMNQLLVDGARTGQEPWSRLHAAGHAEHWGPAADYIEANVGTWTSALLR